MSEAGDAPYGDHLVLTKSYWPFGQYYGKVIFAGYCGGRPEIRWLEKHHLKVACRAEKVIKRLGAFKEVEIQYEIVEETPHNNAPRPMQ